uniref:DNA polymerase III subunit gamma/tau n=1 Tax=candidate division WOR-3 bacterium TaxID=2052148 RepID=A0A7C6AFI9_UNCW3
MAHRVFSLKYRPQNFDELTGQNHIVLSLKGAINSGAIGHAFLFAGPRGVGKTTTARILAKSLNCINGPTVNPCQECPSCKEITTSRSVDVIEIDGASNRGIDEIRNLRESIKYAPLHGKYKIYIIDEVHMLTAEAFNALLKTLEEPPPSVVFILATTNPAKVPATIVSRCQRFTFKRLSITEISQRLKKIAEKEGIEITDKALYYLALRADGSIRDGESILEQLTSFSEGKITEEDVFKLIGFLSVDYYIELINKIVQNDLKGMVLLLNKGIEDGADVLEIYKGLVGYLRKTLLAHIGLDYELIESTPEEINLLKNIALNIPRIINLIETSLRFEDIIKRSINPRIALELLFTQLIINSQINNKTQPGKGNQDIFQTQKVLSNKERLIAYLSKKSPKISAIIYQTDLVINGNNVEISAYNDFQHKELAAHQKLLTEALKNILNQDVNLKINIVEAQKKSNNITDTIITMFDGEEVR